MGRLELNNSESGLSVRNKLNTMFTELYSVSSNNDNLDETKFKDLGAGTNLDILTSNGASGFAWKNNDTLFDDNIKANYLKGVISGTTNKVIITDGGDGFNLLDYAEGIFSTNVTPPAHISGKAQWFLPTGGIPQYSTGSEWKTIAVKDLVSLPSVNFVDLPTSPTDNIVVILAEQERPIWYDTNTDVWRNFSGSEVNM